MKPIKIMLIVIGLVADFGLAVLLGIWGGRLMATPGATGDLAATGFNGIEMAMILGAAILLVVLALFWVIFPWMVYVLLKKIEKNTRQRQ